MDIEDNTETSSQVRLVLGLVVVMLIVTLGKVIDVRVSGRKLDQAGQQKLDSRL